MRPRSAWEQRFVSTTRGQVVLLLRRARPVPAPTAGASPETRAEAAVHLLNELGGLAEAEQVGASAFVVRGYACPLAEVLPDHPGVCRMAETLLQEATGLAGSATAVPPLCPVAAARSTKRFPPVVCTAWQTTRAEADAPPTGHQP